MGLLKVYEVCCCWPVRRPVPCWRAVLGLWLLASAPNLAGPTPTVQITVFPAKQREPISRYLFGKFTEHLGRNVYQGAWAQIVVNPEFAPASLWPSQPVLEKRLEEAARVFRLPELVQDASHHVPAFWQASAGLRVRWLEASSRYVAEVTSLEGGGCLATGVWLPLHRTQQFELTLRARAEPAARVRVELVTSEGQPVGTAEALLPERWISWQGRIGANADGHQPGQPYQLRICLPPETLVQLDAVLLFPADHVDGWEPEVVDYMRRARLPMLRFPGGNFASGYHWEDGVGPWQDRPVRPNPAWPEVEWNHVGTAEWLRLCELTGAQPLICVNAGNGSAEEAARWVQYCNAPASTTLGRHRASHGHPQPYGVRYWEIGNELWGQWQIGHTDGAGYARRYRQFAREMLRADPELLLIANGQARNLNGPKILDLTPGWNQLLLQQNGTAVRSISVHSLEGASARQASGAEEVWQELVAFADAYLEYLDALVASPMRAAGLEPRVAITEMQIFTNVPHLPHNKTIAEALWLASLIHAALRSDGLVELITHSALVNHGGGLAKDRGIVYADPVWWTTHLYGSQEGLYLQHVRVEGSPVFSSAGRYILARKHVPWVDAVALEGAGQASSTLFVINRHPGEAMAVEIRLEGFPAEPDVEGITLAASSLLERNSWDAPERIRPAAWRGRLQGSTLAYTLPPLSLTRFVFRRAKSDPSPSK